MFLEDIIKPSSHHKKCVTQLPSLIPCHRTICHTSWVIVVTSLIPNINILYIIQDIVQARSIYWVWFYRVLILFNLQKNNVYALMMKICSSSSFPLPSIRMRYRVEIWLVWISTCSCHGSWDLKRSDGVWNPQNFSEDDELDFWYMHFSLPNNCHKIVDPLDKSACILLTHTPHTNGLWTNKHLVWWGSMIQKDFFLMCIIFISPWNMNPFFQDAMLCFCNKKCCWEEW